MLIKGFAILGNGKVSKLYIAVVDDDNILIASCMAKLCAAAETSSKIGRLACDRSLIILLLYRQVAHTASPKQFAETIIEWQI